MAGRLRDAWYALLLGAIALLAWNPYLVFDPGFDLSFAAVAGSLFAFYLSFINVESFVLEVSVQIIAMVIIGGTATLIGPVIGAVIVLLLPALLTYIPYLPPTEIGSIQQMIYGLAMVLLMIFRPSGLWGYGSDSRKRGEP